MNLIYDRTAEDVERALALAKKAEVGTLTDAEKTEWLAGMKGCYNATDLNRVEAAVQTLAAELNAAGYAVAVEPVLKGGSRLPSGYTEVEYIESSGTQYIDTGFKPGGTTTVGIDFQMINQGTTQQAIFGSRPGASGRFTVFTGFSTSSLQVDYDTYATLASEKSSISGLNINNRNTIVVSNSLKINGNTISSVSVVAFTSSYNLFLFANNNAGTAQLPGSLKIYSAKIYDNGTLVRNFVPAKNSSGTIGLYDLVNGVFYTNAGSGVFTAGAEISALEDREWRESDIVRLSQWRQYLANVQALRDAYYTLGETGQLPDAEDRLDYIGANNIEKILADIDLLIDWMKSSYRRCGTFRAGNNAAHLPLKGSA